MNHGNSSYLLRQNVVNDDTQQRIQYCINDDGDLRQSDLIKFHQLTNSTVPRSYVWIHIKKQSKAQGLYLEHGEHCSYVIKIIAQSTLYN